MADIELQVTIARAPDEVRQFLLDPDNATRWQGSLKEYELTTPSPVGQGAQSRGVVSVFGQTMEWTAEIVEWDEAGWKWQSLVSNPPWELRWGLEAVGGGTRVTFQKSSPALSGPGGLVARKIVGGQDEKDLQTLRALLEG